MRLLEVVLVGAVLLTLLAVGMQCEDGETRTRRLTRRRERRLKELPGQKSDPSANHRARRRHRLRSTTTTEDSSRDGDAEPVTQNPRGLIGRRHRPVRTHSPDTPYLQGEAQNDGFDHSRLSQELITSHEEVNELYNDTLYNNTDQGDSLMYGEDNSNLTLTPEPTISPENWVNRQRARAVRLFIFQTELLRRLGITRFPQVSPTAIFPSSDTSDLQTLLLGQGLLTDEEHPEPQKDQRTDFQNHLPSCDVPRKSDKNLWYEDGHFRLFFSLAKDRSANTNVTSAILKLYKRPLEDCNCRGNAAQSHKGRRRRERERPNRRSKREDPDDTTEDEGPTKNGKKTDRAEDPKLTVRILKYIRPLKHKKKAHTKPVITKKVAASYEGWVNFNILSAVRNWKKQPNRNFGLTVETTLNKAKVETDRIFDSFNCSAASNVTVLPNPFRLTVAVIENSDNETIVYNVNETYPNLGVVTVYTLQVRRPRPLRRSKRTAARQMLRCVRQRRILPVADTIKDIISPPHVDAGRCVVRGHGNMRMTHAMCGPVQHRPFNILYVDDQGVMVSGTLEGIIINRCAFQTSICSSQPGLCV